MISFLRRIPPAIEWRVRKAWERLTQSRLRRRASGRAMRAGRAVRNRSGSSSKRIVLRFGNALGNPIWELRYYADAVEELSAGQMRVEFVNHWTHTGNPREETTTVAGVGRGDGDLCWAGTRAFGCLGVRSLDPLQTPMLFQDYAAVDAACRDELMLEMLEPLERIGLTGLVVLPGALRKPFAFTRRLIDPRDFEGARLRIHESLVADATYRALGAQAVLLAPDDMSYRPETKVDGMDLQTAAIVSWGVSGSVTFNVPLWPRTLAIVASKATHDWLGTAEREVLAEAGRRALARALDELDGQEQRDRDELPATVGIVTASDDQLVRLREQVEPVWQELRTHPETAAGLRRLEDLIARASGGVSR